MAHITADERTSWNSAKASIDAFLKDADMTEKAVDTLAELQTYMTTDGAAAAELVGRVAALEEIDHEAYKGADTALETSLKSYVDQAESDALAAAKSYADGKFQVAGNYETAGAAAQALADAKADAASLYQVKIDDLDDIRSGAAAGKTALQAVPAGYVTETELTGKGYLTANDFGFATDEDIDGLFS